MALALEDDNDNRQGSSGQNNGPSDNPTLDDLHTRLGSGSYRELARRTGLNRSYIARILQGKASGSGRATQQRKATGPSFEVMSRLADAAGVSLDELRYYIASTMPKGEST